VFDERLRRIMTVGKVTGKHFDPGINAGVFFIQQKNFLFHASKLFLLYVYGYVRTPSHIILRGIDHEKADLHCHLFITAVQ
jgi:hypothetical protein